MQADHKVNSDDKEIKKFDGMAHQWWDEDGDCKPLHLINPLRANYIDSHSPVAEKNIVDIGCGGGILTEALAQRGAKATGIDLAKTSIEVAKLHALESQLTINYQCTSAERFAEEHSEQFDIVTCLEMLEHVPDPLSTINACTQLLKPGGDLFLSTLNRNPKSYLMAIVGAEYILKWLPKGTHEYKQFIRPSELAAWCRECGLVVNDLVGIVYNPLTQSFKLQANDVDVNYIMWLSKPS